MEKLPAGDSQSINERDREERVVEKAVHLPGFILRTITGDVLGVSTVDVAVAGSGEKCSETGGDDDVVGEQRAILKTEAAIEAEFVAGFVRLQGDFDGLGFGEPNVVHVGEGFQLRRDVNVGADAKDEDTGVYEV